MALSTEVTAKPSHRYSRGNVWDSSDILGVAKSLEAACAAVPVQL